MSPSSKVIVVTGASRGIGLAAAKYLLQRNHSVVAVARSRGPLEDLQKEYPAQVAPLVGDLADFKLGARAVELALSCFTRLDGLIINHGVLAPVKRLADSNPDEWRSAFDVNVFSAIALIKAALPQLRQNHGKVIMLSSGAASRAYTAWGAYGASKAVLNHLVKTLAAEEPNVTSVAIRPGVVDTDMQRELREAHLHEMDESDSKKFTELHTSGKLVSPEKPGAVIAAAALDAPSELSGEYVNWEDETVRKLATAN